MPERKLENSEENIGVNVHDLGSGSGFSDTASKAQVTEEK